MRSHGLLFTVGVGALLLAPLPADCGPAANAVEVTASALNVRSGPSTRNGKVGLVRRGQAYPELERSGSWVKLQLGDRTGWSHGNYLRRSNLPLQVVTASSLNVRSGASTRYRVLGRLRRGTPVAVAGSSGSWRRIAFSGRSAWVHGNYLADANGSTPPPNPGGRRVSRAGFIQLPASGPGFYGYYAGSKRWGTPRLVYGIERIAARLQRERPGSSRIGVGDISVENGGRISGHASHRYGVDVDLAVLRNDGKDLPRITIHSRYYSRSLNQWMIDQFVADLDVTHIFFNDSRTRHTQRWPNHDNHLHVRIRR